MSEMFATYYLEIWEILLRLVLAAGLGFAVGFERSVKSKPLGFRPFMMVSAGSCLFAMLVLELGLGPLTANGIAQVDVSRVMQGVIGGIGFLGAGAIIQSRADGGLIGSTTGAGIWMAGGIGMSVGFGLYIYALLAAAVAVVIFVIFGMLRAEIDENTEDMNGKT
ncbi:MAG: MgtC/SapB family protein [Alphaproteobacteria bacterium]